MRAVDGSSACSGYSGGAPAKDEGLKVFVPLERWPEAARATEPLL